MTAARILNFKREDAAKISFLMSIPALAGTGVFGFYALIIQNNSILNLNSILTIFFHLYFHTCLLNIF